jgi:hypothetical protein
MAQVEDFRAAPESEDAAYRPGLVCHPRCPCRCAASGGRELRRGSSSATGLDRRRPATDVANACFAQIAVIAAVWRRDRNPAIDASGAGATRSFSRTFAECIVARSGRLLERAGRRGPGKTKWRPLAADARWLLARRKNRGNTMNGNVLVVGAGPVGLTMACELARYQVPIRIVDKAPQRTDKSKAIVLWSRTLELLDRGAETSRPFLEGGFKVPM